MQVSCLPTAPVHLKSLGNVEVTRVGSGTGPIGSLMVVPILGSVCAMAAKPAAPTPAATAAPKINLATECMSSSPLVLSGRMIGGNRDSSQRRLQSVYGRAGRRVPTLSLGT